MFAAFSAFFCTSLQNGVDELLIGADLGESLLQRLQLPYHRLGYRFFERAIALAGKLLFRLLRLHLVNRGIDREQIETPGFSSQ